jgi:3-methyladenine DNA glycosylase/8-oxoguanine DNA glycosylase
VTAARNAGRVEQCADLPYGDAADRLVTLPGIGVWTAAEVAQRALGDADAVSFGDLHMAKDVSFALVGEALGDDDLREILRPWAGHRYRVVRLCELSGVRRPRRAPRFAPRDFRAI